MSSNNKAPIAVVGIGCRMPGSVTNPQEFWDVLIKGRDVIKEIPPDRWSIESFHDHDQTKHGKMVTKKCGFIDGIDMFDNAFFKISPREAASMDPQQRHILEVTYEAFQDAGIIPDTLGETCGVYMGVGLMDYSIVSLDTTLINPYTLTGNAHSSIANRISYVFNLRGPSMIIDTACASSVTAMHLACCALWEGECSIAAVGGCNSLLIPEMTAGFSALGVLSPVGKSCPFSDSAQGYVRSEGWGTLILKPLDDALQNNDNVYAVIRGSAVAANGFSKSITMPSAEAQEMVIRSTYKRFNIPMSSVGYVEAHGTGTPVGDPIEAEAIGVTFGPERQTPVKVGSVKSNFGHSECAAGMAAAIKISLMLQNKILVPNINFNEINPGIDMKHLNIQVLTKSEKIDNESTPYTIGLNSFGFVGAIAHMVFQEAPLPISKSVATCGWVFGSESKSIGKAIVIPLSAKTQGALKDLAIKWISFVSPNDALSVSSWQATRRDHHQYRVAVIANSAESFRNTLTSYIKDEGSVSLIAGTANQNKPKICFVFPGHGQQWIDMGRTLYMTEPIFRETIQECDKIFKQLSGWSILETCSLFNGRSTSEISSQEAVKLIDVIQPAILFIQIGIFHLWGHWGVKPDVVVGHSLGETAAAYACGGLNLQNSIAVVYSRSKEQAKLTGTGGMAALRANFNQAKEICEQRQGVYISAVNGPGDVTLGGDASEIAALVVENPGKAKQLRATCPFHTPLMELIKESFKESMKGAITEHGKHQIPYYSTVTGHYYQKTFDVEYWWSNIRQPVLFQSAVEEIIQDTDIDIFLEVSAAATLLASVKQIVRSVNPDRGVSTIYSGLREKDDLHSIQRALGSLYVAGVDFNWSNVTKNAAKWTPIPTYPWQHKSFWLETEDRQTRRLGLDDRTFKGCNGRISLTDFPFLADHQLDDRIVFPGSGYVEYIAEMHFEENESPEMTNINFTKVLPWPEVTDNKKPVLNLSLIKDGEHIQVKCKNNVHCNATLRQALHRQSTAQSLSVNDIFKRCNKDITNAEFCSILQQTGFQYGPAFQVVEKVLMGDGESLAYLAPITDTSQRISIPHLDATFQLAQVTAGSFTSMYLPIHIDSLRLTPSSLCAAGETLVAYTQILDYGSQFLEANITIARESGVILAEVRGYKAQNFHGSQTDVDIDSCIYTTQWQPISAYTLPTTVIEDAFNETHLNTAYSDDMKAILRAEEVLDDLKGICASYIRNALEKTPEGKRVKGHTYETYISRYNTIASSTAVKYIPHEKIPEVIERIQKICPEFEPEVLVLQNLGEALPDTLRDPHSAVSFSSALDCLNKYFYDSLSTRIHYKVVSEAVAKVVHESLKHKRVVRIFEMGGRIGGLTRFVLEPLKELGESHQLEYVFADFNSSAFKEAESNLEAFPFIQYKQLNIGREVSRQGFVTGSFDVVICLDSLHGTVDAERSTSYISQLLAPNGLMFVIEPTNNEFVGELFSVSFEACWMFDDFRKERCYLDQQGWVNVMKRVGLQDIVSASTPKEFFHSVIVGRGVNAEPTNDIILNANPTELLIVGEINKQFAEEMQSAYKGCIDLIPFSDAKPFQRVFKDKTSNAIEVMYIYSDADKNLHVLLKLLQAVKQCSESVSRVWVLSKGASKDPTKPNASLAVGLVRSISNHIPNVPIFSIDFDATCNCKETTEAMVSLMRESDLLEREIVIRHGVRYVPRTVHQQLQTSEVVSESWRVEQQLSAKGHNASIDDLAFHNVDYLDVPSGHVKISVRAAPLNFKDVMMSMGLLENLDAEAHPSFGIECAGVVEELGKGVSNLKVGDEVIAFGKKCFASRVICNAQLTTLKPHNLDWIESASIGIVFVTAYFSLVKRANLQPTETILIHSACGGVGLAAIQIAQMLGAKIICTAGTKKKREYLKDVLGVEFVSDSRSTQFYNDVMSFTEGRGVDVVLNSLSGKLLFTSMSVLAPFGRFCEIGKRDILQNSNLPMNTLLENKLFISCQIDIMMQQSPSTVQRLMKNVINLFETSKLRPIPVTVYSMGRLTEAFHMMSKGLHIGKMVFSIEDEFKPVEIRPALQQFASKATYIVTGGFGGIGQALARWLCDNGAKHIVLVSRNGPKSAAARRMMKYIEGKEAIIHQYHINVSDYQSVKCMLEELRKDETVPPIRGIFHLAGIIEESDFLDLTVEEMDQMLGGKASGAFNLHTLTKEDNLEIFFLLSSIMTVWGNPAQPAYTAANNYLDALAEHRHLEGLPALSVQLGPLRGAGYLEDKGREQVKVMEMKGTLQIHVDELLDVMARLLVQRGLPVVCLAHQDWRLTQQFCHKSMLKFHHLTTIKRTADMPDIVMGKEDMEAGMKSKMAEILCMPVDAIDVNQPMINYGVDSLVAIELVTWATNQLGITISQMDILGGITTAALLQMATEQLD